jgi:hypothetical protein
LQETDCCIRAAHPCTWCAQLPDNGKDQNAPCVGLIHAVFENNSLDNIQDKDNFIAISNFLYWINKQDVEPFKIINYKK